MNSNNALIPLTEGTIQGHRQPLCDARDLHAFLEVRRDFTNWMKQRIAKYGFVEGEDYEVYAKFGVNLQGDHAENVCSPNLASKGRGGHNAVEYRLTMDMAKELAMVERTARGREARRYFIDCERQLRQLQQAVAATHPAAPVVLSRAQKQAINRQAWADVAGQAYANFHARREELLRNLSRAEDPGPLFLHRDFRPRWAR